MSRFKTVSRGAPVRREEQSQLTIHVVCVGEQEPVAALRQADKLARGLGAHLVLVAPQVVPYGVDLDQPPVNPDFTAARMVRIAAKAGVEADVNVVLCRDRIEGLESVLETHAVVIAGEKKLARQLNKHGHQVLAADRSFGHQEREGMMLDLFYGIIAVFFFAMTWVFTKVCDRL